MIKRWFVSSLAEIIILNEDKIAISIVGRRYTIDDPFGMLRSILNYIEDGADMEMIEKGLSECFPAGVVSSTLKSLIDTKVLVEKDSRTHGDSTHDYFVYCHDQSNIFSDEQRTLYLPESWSVILIGEGALAESLDNIFKELNINIERKNAEFFLPLQKDKRQLIIACADFENFPMFRTVNQSCINNNIPALYVALDWSTVHCGPLVLPKASACYECYFHRLRSSRRFISEFDARANPNNILYQALPNKLAIQWAKAEVSRLALHYLNGTLDHLHKSHFESMNTQNGEIDRSVVLRLPRCPICGVSSINRPASPVFQHALLRRGS